MTFSRMREGALQELPAACSLPAQAWIGSPDEPRPAASRNRLIQGTAADAQGSLDVADVDVSKPAVA